MENVDWNKHLVKAHEARITGQSIEEKIPKEAVLNGHLRFSLEIEDFIQRTFQYSVCIFLSSTFDDTKFEQNALLEKVFPFLRVFCAALGLSFEVATMRWGVRSRSGNDHQTSELCMKQLYKSMRSSAGTAYCTILGHRYGYRPFPCAIEKSAFENILSHLECLPADISVLRSPFWKLDCTSAPAVYRLQPVSSLSGCEGYLLTDEDKLRGKTDAAFRSTRMAVQRQASMQWWRYFEAMQELLRKGAQLCSHSSMTDEKRRAFEMSVTEDEVNRGVLNNPCRDSTSIAFLRHIHGLESGLITDPSGARVYIDSLPGVGGAGPHIDEEARSLLQSLKLNVEKALPAHRVHSFDVPWVNGSALSPKQPKEPPQWEGYIGSFCDRFVDSVCADALARYRLPLKDSSLLKEVLLQRQSVLSQLECVGFDRSAVLVNIMQYCSSVDSEPRIGSLRPLIIHGSSGAGKTWIMSRAIRDLRESAPSGTVVIYRLLGTSPQSCDVWQIIKSISEQLLQCYGLTSFAKDPRIPSSINGVPLGWKDCAQWFASGTAFNIPAIKDGSKPLVLFLDSLDQLSPMYNGLDDIGNWCPGFVSPLPSNVRVVLSTLTHFPPKWPIVAKLRSLLSADLAADACFLSIPDLSLHSVGSALDEMAKGIEPQGTIVPTQRRLSEAGKSFLADLFVLYPSPLFLSIALREVARWPSYEETDEAFCRFRDRIVGVSGGSSQAAIKAVIQGMFHRLEDVHGKLLVSRMMAILCASREGLSALEIEDILSMDDELLDDVFEWWEPPVRRLPPLLVQRVIDDAGHYLASRGAVGGSTVYNWFHRQFAEAAREKYFSGELKAYALSAIVKYYSNEFPSGRHIESQPYWRACSDISYDYANWSVNLRKCIELPHALYLQHTDAVEKLMSVLVDVNYIFAMISSKLYGLLVSNIAGALDICRRVTVTSPAFNESLREAVEMLGQALRLSLPALEIEWDKALEAEGDLEDNKQALRGIFVYLEEQAASSHELEASDTPNGKRARMLEALKHLVRDQSDGVLSDTEIDSIIASNVLSSDGSITCDDMVNILLACEVQLKKKSWAYSDVLTSLCTQLLGRLRRLSPEEAKNEYIVAIAAHCNEYIVKRGGYGLLLPSLQRPDKLCVGLLTVPHWSVACMCVLQDGRLAAGGSDPIFRDRGVFICIWNPATSEQDKILKGHKWRVTSICTLRDGRLASGAQDLTVRIWSLEKMMCSHVLRGHTHHVRCVCESSAGALVSVCEDPDIRVWEVPLINAAEGNDANGQSISACRRIMNGPAGWIYAAIAVPSSAYGPDRDIVATCGESSTICLWDCSSGELLREFANTMKNNYGILSSRDGNRIFSCATGELVVWDVATGAALKRIPHLSDDGLAVSLFSLCLLPDNRVVSGTQYKDIYVWDSNCSACSYRFSNAHGSGEVITALCVLDGGKLASSCNDGTIRLWNVPPDASGERKCSEFGIRNPHESRVASMCALHDLFFASASHDGSVKVWKTDTFDLVRILIKCGFKNYITSLCSYPINRLLACGTYDNTIQVWQYETGEWLYDLNGHADPVFLVSRQSSGLLASACSCGYEDDYSVRLWTIIHEDELSEPRQIPADASEKDNARCIQVLRGHSYWVNAACTVPGGAGASPLEWTVVTAARDNTIKHWNVVSGECLHSLKVQREVDYLSPLKTGQYYIAHESRSAEIKFFDVQNGGCVHERNHKLQFLVEDGQRIVTSGNAFKPSIYLDSEAITSAAMLAGNVIAAGTENGKIHIIFNYFIVGS
jgi:WD40 repeat protein